MRKYEKEKNKKLPRDLKTLFVLEDGTFFEGNSIGNPREVAGNVIFTTGVVGYQEILTDPSYKNKIVVFTYPLIGNYGVNSQDNESGSIHVNGVVISEISRITSNWRAEDSFINFLKKNNITGISGLDTRSVTLHIREKGEMYGIISSLETDVKKLLSKIKTHKKEKDRNIIKDISLNEIRHFNAGNVSSKPKIVIVDLGLKNSFLNHVLDMCSEVVVVPYNTKAEKILSLKPDGIIIYGGPETLEFLSETEDEIKKILGKKPILGVCLGHILIGKILGIQINKMHCGHHGNNYPVKNLERKTSIITSQNHSYIIDSKNINNKKIKITHININDSTVEGIKSEEHNVSSIQYEPSVDENGKVDSTILSWFNSLKVE